MKLDYYLIDPTRNLTALITSQVSLSHSKDAAARVMESEPSCEQAGFVYINKRGEPCLRMAGGEFCGNASMSAAALYCKNSGINTGETREIYLNVSGTEEPVYVRVTAESDVSFYCDISMPKPEKITIERLFLNDKEYCLSAVFFSGITHLIISAEVLSHKDAERAIKKWCNELKAEALGIMLYNNEQALEPLVYVPKADTLFWESSCASGTCAFGAYMADKNGEKTELSVKQPGGTLKISADINGEMILSGRAVIIKKNSIV